MIDLRSDTLSMPTAAMLACIGMAQLGDDGRLDAVGRGGDRAVNELEDLAAELTGKQAGLLVPTGTMGNNLALLTYCKPGDQVLTEPLQHLYRAERMAFSENLGRLQAVFYGLNEAAIPDVEELERLLHSGNIKLLCLENTHNSMGGACLPMKALREIRKLTAKFRVPIHMDGARLFNAAAALGVEAADICRETDSVMFCLSKGLGAPVGSLLCGTAEFIGKARELRKMLGGGMRQAGVLAAPGSYALRHNRAALVQDHAKARMFAAALSQSQLLKVQIPQTNIVILDTSSAQIGAEEFCKQLAEHGLLAAKTGTYKIRLVFYRDIDETMVQMAAEAVLSAERAVLRGDHGR
mgnify:CR=1 FL=1